MIVQLTRHIPLVEKAILVAVAAGALVMWLDMGTTVLGFSLLGLAVTSFLMGYRPVDIARQENEPFGFIELLGFTIIPKVLWISCAICSVGLAFYVMDVSEGYKEMLLIGGMTIGVGAVILLVLKLQGVKHINVVMPILLRALPLALTSLYIMFG